MPRLAVDEMRRDTADFLANTNHHWLRRSLFRSIRRVNPLGIDIAFAAVANYKLSRKKLENFLQNSGECTIGDAIRLRGPVNPIENRY